MAKTLVVAAHSAGPHPNGYDNCHARIGYDGICPGVSNAAWLNSLGEDHEPYSNNKSITLTCGEVRDNYIKNNYHVIPLYPHLAEQQAIERRLTAELRLVRRRIRQMEEVTK